MVFGERDLIQWLIYKLAVVGFMEILICTRNDQFTRSENKERRFQSHNILKWHFAEEVLELNLRRLRSSAAEISVGSPWHLQDTARQIIENCNA